MSFGPMPLANAFLSEADIASEEFYPLEPAICERCGTFQLTTQPAPSRLFRSGYPFRTGSSTRMVAHFTALAAELRRRCAEERPLVVEIGANDGTLLAALTAAGCCAIGVEPVNECAAAIRARGLEVVEGFFNAATAGAIAAAHGCADVIVAANVICHIPDVHDLAAGICRLLEDAGLFVFEDPYLGDMLEVGSYDQIYDEHVFVWSATSVAAAFQRHGLELIDVQPLRTHGGSLRYVLARTGRYPAAPSVEEVLAHERARGLSRRDTYERFRSACEASRDALSTLLHRLHDQGRRVEGYAATSKSTTVLNYGRIGPTLIQRIADSTPAKQGKLTPGMHIPIVSPEHFMADPPDFAVLFAWNHAAEIFEKARAFPEGGGRWIRFVPDVRILD